MGLKQVWGEYYKSAVESIASLEKELSDLDVLQKGPEVRDLLKQYLTTAAEFLEPFIGLGYELVGKHDCFVFSSRMSSRDAGYWDGRLFTNEGRISRIEVNFADHQATNYSRDNYDFLVCEKNGDELEYYICYQWKGWKTFKGLFRKKEEWCKESRKCSIGDYVDTVLINEKNKDINEKISNLVGILNDLVDYLPKPLLDKVNSLRNNIKEKEDEIKNLESFSENFSSLDEKMISLS